MPRYSKHTNPISGEEMVKHIEDNMRRLLSEARNKFLCAYGVFSCLEVEDQVELWKRFNATERRLMKDAEGKEWSSTNIGKEPSGSTQEKAGSS